MCRYIILLISTFYNILHSTRPFKDYFKWIDRTGFDGKCAAKAQMLCITRQCFVVFGSWMGVVTVDAFAIN